jgi:hypothetical protein
VTSTANEPVSLSIIVTSAERSGVEGEVEIREPGPWRVVKDFFVARKEIPLDKVNDELDRIQEEVDVLLSKLDSREKHGFILSEVAVSLGISAEGSIGIVSAGVEAGITLSFSKGVNDKSSELGPRRRPRTKTDGENARCVSR